MMEGVEYLHLSLLSWKIICLIAIWLVSFCFGLIPFSLKSKNDKDSLRYRLLSIGNAFSGGVFLGGGFCHLLPDAWELWQNLNFTTAPIAPVLSVCGFLLVFLLEKVIFLHKHPHTAHPDEHILGHHHYPGLDEDTRTKKDIEVGSSSSVNAHITSAEEGKEPLLRPEKKIPSYDDQKSQTKGKKKGNLFLPIILTLVLSVHSLIAGFTMGVQPQFHEVITIFIAIISHKWTESFSLGVTLVKSNVHSWLSVFKFLTIYSLMTPLGVILGLVLSLYISGTPEAIVNAVSSGIASGTFIYIALIDILMHEFSTPQDKWIKYFMILIGFGMMTGSVFLFDKS